MPDKWRRPRSLGEIFNATLDATLRILKVIVYGWDGSSAVALRVGSDGSLETMGNNKYATNCVDDYTTASVTYIGKEGASTADWWFIKISEVGDYPVFTHATVLNNPTVLNYNDAFSARTSLTYSNFSSAF